MLKPQHSRISKCCTDRSRQQQPRQVPWHLLAVSTCSEGCSPYPQSLIQSIYAKRSNNHTRQGKDKSACWPHPLLVALAPALLRRAVQLRATRPVNHALAAGRTRLLRHVAAARLPPAPASAGRGCLVRALCSGAMHPSPRSEPTPNPPLAHVAGRTGSRRGCWHSSSWRPSQRPSERNNAAPHVNAAAAPTHHAPTQHTLRHTQGSEPAPVAQGCRHRNKALGWLAAARG
jgi:hypothetical protein